MNNFYLIILTLFCHLVFAQNPSDEDPMFNNPNKIGFKLNSDVVNCVTYANNKIYIGGLFTSYFESTAPNIVCINVNGGIDTSFFSGTGFNNVVNCIEQTNNGQILVCGDFTNYNGFNANRITMLNQDGTIDGSFVSGSGFNGVILTIAEQLDGKLLIGGDFTNYNGTAVNKIVRLNSNGTIDSTFVTGIGFNNSVKSIAIQSDGKILIGGAFTSFNGVNKNRIIRLNDNGSVDTLYDITIGFNNNVNKIVLDTDGNAIIGGDFTTYSVLIPINQVLTLVNRTANRLIKLTSGGINNNATSYGIGLNSTVFAIQLLSNNRTLIGGSFTNFNGSNVNKILIANSDGTIDSTFSPNSNNILNNSILSLATISSAFLLGGSFDSKISTNEGTQNFNKIKLIGSNGVTASGFAKKIGVNTNNPSALTNVSTLGIKTDGKILIGGNFGTYNNSITNHIVQLDSNGYIDSSFNSGTGFSGPQSSVNYIVPQTDGKILVSGGFTRYNGVQLTKYVTRLNSNGTIDNSFSTNNFTSNSTYILFVQSDGKILCAQTNYTFYNGVALAKIMRLNNDGSIDSTFVSPVGFNLSVLAIAVQSNGKIIIGGNFTTYSGITANKIIRLNSNGSIDTSFQSGSGFDDIVYDIAVQSDNKIIVGGIFQNYNGSSASKLVRLNSDGTVDNTFNLSGTGFNNGISKITIQNDGKILIGGAFTMYNGLITNNLIRLNTNATKDNTFITEAIPNNPLVGSGVSDIAIQSDNKILVVGGFFTTTSNNRRQVVRLIGGTSNLSNNTIQFENLVVYPNPVKESLYISINTNYEYDIVSRFIYHKLLMLLRHGRKVYL